MMFETEIHVQLYVDISEAHKRNLRSTYPSRLILTIGPILNGILYTLVLG